MDTTSADPLFDDASFYSNPANETLLLVAALFIVVFCLFFVAGTYAVVWKMFNRAGESGWKALVPFYNIYMMNKIGNSPPSYFWLYLISQFLIFIPVIGAVGVLVFSILIFVNFLLRYQHPNYALFIVLMILLTPACLFMMKGLTFKSRPTSSTPVHPQHPSTSPPVTPSGPHVPLV